jgi:hypothetical protein
MPALSDHEFYKCVPEGERLLRLCFEPEHILHGKPIPAIIGIQDLDKRGVSLDREHIVERSVILERAAEQSAKLPEKRTASYIVKLHADAIRADKDSEGRDIADICCSPLPNNGAHAHLLSAYKREEKVLRALRIQLVDRHFQDVASLGDYIDERWPNRSHDT